MQDFERSNLIADTCSLSGSGRPRIRRPPRTRSRYRVRTIKSKGAVLVLVWCLLVWGVVHSLFLRIFYSRLHLPILTGASHSVLLVQLIECMVWLLWAPIAGWLADVYFGKFRVMWSSIWLTWCASVVVVLAFLIQYLHPGVSVDTLNYGLLLPACILIAAGCVGFFVNVIQFGTDQMQESSAEEVSAFIHWFIWTWFAGFAFSDTLWTAIHFCIDFNHISGPLMHIQQPQATADMVTALAALAVLSAIISTRCFFQNWLTMEPESRNPLKTILSVMKYAATHKQPTMRSALTYWEEDIPSRINLGKSKYGGPFTTEQVEDVKTFWRILAVVVSICLTQIPSGAIIISMEPLLSHFTHSDNAISCRTMLLPESYTYMTIVALSIPFYELVVHPLATRWIPSMLKRAGIGAILVVLLNVFLLSVDAIGHSKSKGTPCMLLMNETSPPLEIDSKWVEIPLNTLISLGIMFLFISIFEFIYAQAPYSMKGLLTGLVWAFYILSITLGYFLVYVLWRIEWKRAYTNPSCGVWYYLTTTLISVVSFLILCAVAKWYRQRQRDECVNEHTFVENFYDRYTVAQPLVHASINDDLSSDYDSYNSR